MDSTSTLPIWQARSFWAQIAAALTAVAALLGWHELAAGAETLPDHVMPLITAALGAWAYIERLLGSRKLTL